MAFKPEFADYQAITANAIEHYLKDKEAREFARVALEFLAEKEIWEGLIAVPPDSPIDRVLQAFEKETDIPLILPFCAFMHLVSTYLVKKKVVINLEGQYIRPDIWTIVLAPSGKGKTLSFNVLEKVSDKVLNVRGEFSNVAGAAAFVEELEQKNRTLWVADEFAQTLQQIETPNSPMSQCKEYLLKTYDGKLVERATKKQTTSIKDPCLVILGLNTFDSFVSKISEESLSDGFSQRFCYLVAEDDPKRPMSDFPFYKARNLEGKIKNAFEAIGHITVHPVYKFSDDALDVYREAFAKMYKGDVQNSFYRRLMFRAFKYALIYHFILGKQDVEIDAQDMGWSLRLIKLHMQDLKKILQAKNFGALEEVVQKCEKMLKDKPAEFSPRKITQNIRSIKSTAQAKQLYVFVLENEKRRQAIKKKQSLVASSK